MALTIEDGTVVPGADSFATVAEADTYAPLLGLSLPVAEVDKEVNLRKAVIYLNSIEHRLKGTRKSEDQELCFPRDNIDLYGKDVSGTIPTLLKHAQIILSVEYKDNDLLESGDGKEVLKEKTGELETEYAQSGISNPVYNPVMALEMLKPLMRPTSGINLVAYR